MQLTLPRIGGRRARAASSRHKLYASSAVRLELGACDGRFRGIAASPDLVYSVSTGCARRCPPVLARPNGGVATKRRTAGRAVAVAVAICALASTSAQAYSPPKGTPDLAKMTLQSSDLAPGATPLLSSYFDPGDGVHLRAEYDRDWGAASTTSGVKLQQVQTQITLATSTTWAHAIFDQIPSIYSSSGDRESLIDNIDAGNGSSASLKDARFGKLRSIGVGQQSMYGSATIATKGSTIAAGFAWVRVDGAIAFLVVVAPKAPLADSVTIGIAKTVAAHMTAVLAVGNR